jgi:hypothetical protein
MSTQLQMGYSAGEALHRVPQTQIQVEITSIKTT